MHVTDGDSIVMFYKESHATIFTSTCIYWAVASVPHNRDVRACGGAVPRQRGLSLSPIHGLCENGRIQETATDRCEATQTEARQQPILLLGHHEPSPTGAHALHYTLGLATVIRN